MPARSVHPRSSSFMAFAHSGKQRRLARLFRHSDGRAVILPIDDGLISGPRGRLSDLHKFFNLIESSPPDAMLLFAGVLNRYSSFLHTVAAIVNLTASTVSTNHTRKTLCTDVEAAIAAGADILAVHVNVTSRHEPDMLPDPQRRHSPRRNPRSTCPCHHVPSPRRPRDRR